MGRVADKYFKIEYEERSDIDPINKLQLMEQQMHKELLYINKLSNLTLGRNVAPETNAELSKVLKHINVVEQLDTTKLQNDVKKRYKNKKNVVFPGKNDNVLEDMVTIVKSPEEKTSYSDLKKKKKS